MLETRPFLRMGLGTMLLPYHYYFIFIVVIRGPVLLLNDLVNDGLMLWDQPICWHD